jgi:hypothetical protein
MPNCIILKKIMQKFSYFLVKKFRSESRSGKIIPDSHPTWQKSSRSARIHNTARKEEWWIKKREKSAHSIVDPKKARIIDA